MEINKMELLVKAAQTTDATQFSGDELLELSSLLDYNFLFQNFKEEDIRSYRDRYSGQPIAGVQPNMDSNGEISSLSFIPACMANRKQIYSGLIFYLMNPAARNLCNILFRLMPSDYARMSMRQMTGWGKIVTILSAIKDWSLHLEIVCNPGPILVPLFMQFNFDILEDMEFESQILDFI